MKKLSESEVKEILKEHDLWLKTDETEGKRADFSNRDLSGMDFRNANLCGADFYRANLKNADFRGADLTDANLNDTDMDGAIYDETTLPAIACPEKGSFIGYKKAFDLSTPDYVGYIVKLRIPEDVKKSSATTNSCRSSKAEVLSITNLDGTETDETIVRSYYDYDFCYYLGETVEVPDFDECRWHERAPGIHFFMSREEAVAW